MTRQVLSFGFIGSIGFIVDACFLLLFNRFIGLDVFSSRLCSFSIAVTATWYLNRKFTFVNQKNDRHAMHEWAYYATLNGIGALLNISIFMWLILRYDLFAESPIIPLAIASGIAMIFNFIISKFIVFQVTKS